MRNIYLILNITLLSLFFISCGGGGGGSSSDASFDTGDIKINVLICNESAPVYTDIKKGDLLVKQTDSTIVQIVHDSDDNKKVCVVSGSAHLLRKN